MKVNFLSPSLIQDYLECPHLYFIKFPAHSTSRRTLEFSASDSQTTLMNVGQAVHDGAKVYLEEGSKEAKACLFEKLRDIRIVEEAWRLLTHLIELLAMYKPLGCEDKYKIQIDGLPPCEARFDFFVPTAGSRRVIELKTGWKLRTREELEQGIEARFFKFILNEVYGEDSDIRISYLFLRHDEWVDVNPIPLDIDYLRHFSGMVEKDSSHFPNRANCYKCSMILACDAVRNLRVENLRQDSTEIALQYLHYKAKTDAYQGLLKTYCQHEDLRVGNWHFYWALVHSYRITSMKNLFRLFRERKIFIKPDMSVLKKHYPDVLDMAVESGYVDKKSFTKFSCIKE